MKLIKDISLPAIAIFFLAACGGAVEGDPTVVDPPVDDTTAPSFIGGDPEGSVTQACLVTAEFNEPIAASSITDQSFKIVEDATSTQLLTANNDGTWQIHPDSNTMALFVPIVTINAGQYTVTVTTDITDVAGNNLAEEPTPGDYTWTFTPILPCAPSI
ncbi:MAG: Ig-like domain-containing protein [Thermodesulfobacteriota bacterium]